MELNCVIRGHHIYKEIWNPFIGEELQCKMEHGNIHDIYAVAVTREDIVVGHLPRHISTPCHLFLRKGGSILCTVTGVRQFSADLVQGGLEIPCRLVFQGSSQDVDKMKNVLQDAPKEQLKQPEIDQEEQTPVQKQLEPADQQNTRKRCVLEQPNVQQNTEKKPSNEEQQRQDKNVIEQPHKKPRKESRHHEQQIVKQAEPTEPHSLGCENVIIIDNIADIDDTDIWLKMCKVTLFIADRKQLTTVGSPLNDKHINLAQMLLKHQFPKLHGFSSTLLQYKKSLEKITVGIQIIHINYHWLTAAKISPDEPLKVYDSVNFSLTAEI